MPSFAASILTVTTVYTLGEKSIKKNIHPLKNPTDFADDMPTPSYNVFVLTIITYYNPMKTIVIL